MTQEEKELLLRDLCGRLPYGVIIEHEGDLSMLDTIFMCDSISISSTSMDKEIFYNLDLDEVKPYLFPLSSMTEEQKEEFDQLIELELKAISDEIEPIQATAFEVDFYNKHHFDWRGMIPLGLANDATGLNIY